MVVLIPYPLGARMTKFRATAAAEASELTVKSGRRNLRELYELLCVIYKGID